MINAMMVNAIGKINYNGVDEVLICVGIMPNKKAYLYVREIMSAKSPYEEKLILQQIAKRENTSVGNIERAIGAAIYSAHKAGRLIQLNNVIGCSVFDPRHLPSVRFFLKILSEYIFGRFTNNEQEESITVHFPNSDISF